MCGLVGIAGSLAHKDEATMKRLFLLDYFRGTDATGFASVSTTGDVKVAKVASNPIDLFDMQRYKAASVAHSSRVFIGHNRAKTVGNNSFNNAHPFEYGHIVGAHNGTLEKSSFRALEQKLEEEFEVDSQAIFACIAKFGIEATIPLLEGAWALVWYNTQEGTLNFIRNEKRPLWYSYAKNHKRIFWASEYAMIDSALKMAGTETDYELLTTSKGHCYFAFPVDTMYSYKVADIVAGTKQPKPLSKVLKGKETPPIAAGSPFMGGMNGGNTIQTGLTQTTHSTTTSPSRQRPADKIKHFVGTPMAPFGGLLTKGEFEHAAVRGCSWCSAEVNWGDTGLVFHENTGTILCRDCNGGTTSMNRVYVKDMDILMKI